MDHSQAESGTDYLLLQLEFRSKMTEEQATANFFKRPEISLVIYEDVDVEISFWNGTSGDVQD